MPVTRWLFLPAFAVISLVAANRATSIRTWHPTLTSVSPSVLEHGTNLTISGTDLAPPGWQRRLTFRRKYGGTSQVNLSCCATPIVVAADKDMRGDSVRVEWVEGTDTVLTRQENPIPQNERVRYLPAEFVVQGAPDLTFEGTLVTADIGPSFRVMVTAANGMGILKGKYLRVFSMPTIKFGGTTISALAHTYEPQGWLDRAETCCSSGADRVVFPLPAQMTSGWLVLDNTMGKDSGAVTFAPPPVASQVVQQTATGTAALTPANTLQRGRNYIVRGQNLSITHTLGPTTSVKRGSVQLGGISIAPTFASDTNIVFTVPTTLTSTSAALSVSTAVGSAQMGTFSIINPPVPIDVVSLSPTLTTITPGKTISVMANLNIPAGAPKELGNLVISAPGAALGTIKIKSPIPVKETPTEIQFSGGDVQVTTPVTLLVAHESNGVGGIVTQTKQMTFNVRPPHPTALGGPSTVTGGSSQTFDVVFDSTTRSGSSIFALLSSSNPNIVAVPPSATISGNKASFTATVPPAPQAGGTTTLTATLDGATASLPVTVALPQIQQASVSSASILPGNVITAGAVLNGALASTEGVSFSSSDTALKRVSNTYAAGQPRTTAAERFIASQAISQPRQVTVTASYAGTSKTATVTINPIVISSFTATPSSAAAGTTITATALLSSPPGDVLNMKMEFASADTMRATVSPASSGVSSTATSKVVSILLRGPVSTPRQVPITATLRVGSSNPNPIVSTQTIVVTVNP